MERVTMLNLGARVVSTWSPSVTGTIVGFGYLFMDGQPDGSGDKITDEMQPVYLVDIGRNRMFDIDREPPGPFAARILVLQMNRVFEVKEK